MTLSVTVELQISHGAALTPIEYHKKQPSASHSARMPPGLVFWVVVFVF
jgi:hypothetical protein